ncbi:MAG: hypothetical protein WC943_06070 [Elusimicrobiota bacterium]
MLLVPGHGHLLAEGRVSLDPGEVREDLVPGQGLARDLEVEKVGSYDAAGRGLALVVLEFSVRSVAELDAVADCELISRGGRGQVRGTLPVADHGFEYLPELSLRQGVSGGPRNRVAARKRTITSLMIPRGPDTRDPAAGLLP